MTKKLPPSIKYNFNKRKIEETEVPLICGEECFWDEKIQKPSEIIKKYINKFKNLIPFQPSDIVSESPQSLHNSANKFLFDLKEAGNSNLPSLKSVAEKMKKCLISAVSIDLNETLFIGRLIKTDPEELFDPSLWAKNCLRLRADTLCWTAAYVICGSQWGKIGQHFQGFKRVKFKESITLGPKVADLFLSKELKTPVRPHQLRQDNFKYKTFVKICTPRFASESVSNMEQELITHLK